MKAAFGAHLLIKYFYNIDPKVLLGKKQCTIKIDLNEMMMIQLLNGNKSVTVTTSHHQLLTLLNALLM